MDEIINKTRDHVEKLLSQESSGHDWWHIYRVWKASKYIAKYEGCVNTKVVELAALLHDIKDWKFNNGDLNAGPNAAREWLQKHNLDSVTIEAVADIIYKMSYKGAGVSSDITTLEGKIVQDADRLDAIGAIGIARAFAYGGSKGRLIYDPNETPRLHQSFEEYKNNKGASLSHFHEKLLLLKDRLNTNTAKRIAEKRHQFLLDFIDQFMFEWNEVSE